MYYFLAKLGRRRWVRFVMPMVTMSTTFGYFSCHTYLHHKVRDIFAADQPDGSREEISDHVRELIKSVYIEVKDKINQPANKLEEFFVKRDKPSPIKWYSSSTIEPITYGSTRLETGTLIGLPKFYNYQTVDQIPSSMFEISELNFFRSPQDTDVLKREREDFELSTGRTALSGPVRRIDRTSPEGMDYASSLVLSDNAIKFAIARELFLADTGRPILLTFVVALAMTFATTIGRAGVVISSSQQARVTRRIFCYFTGGGSGLVLYKTLRPVVENSYAKIADDRAMKIGPQYREGATEYFAKRALRYHCLGIQ